MKHCSMPNSNKVANVHAKLIRHVQYSPVLYV